jgi:hypothetical protein
MTTANPTRPVLKLRGPADIVAAVPYMVGFEPADSLVVVALRGRRGRVALTMRVDLPPPEWAEECAGQLIGHLKRHRAERAVIAVYPASEGPRHPAVRAVSDALTDRLERARIGIVEAVCVHAGRWWSLTCTVPDCCPPDGTPIERDGTSTVDAAMVVEGRAVLPSREALASTLNPVAGLAGKAAGYALIRVESSLVDRIWSGRRAEVAAESLALLRAAVQRRQETPMATLGVDEAARLIVGLDDVPVRDEVLTWFDGEEGAAAVGVLRELVRHAPPPFDVVPLTVFAWLSYLRGDGVIAGIAVDRALDADPTYNLARLLSDALDAALDPKAFREIRRDIARESVGDGGG